MNARIYFRGGVAVGFPCRGMRVGRLGLGGGVAMRWLKLKRDDVEDCGPLSLALYEAARRRLIRGEFRDDRIMSACVYVLVRSRVGGI